LVEPWLPDTHRVEELRQAAESALAVARAHVEQYWPDVELRTSVVAGPPAAVLADAAHHAALTVVGGRQLSTLGALVLGSISTVVAGTAAGPVVVVGQRSDEPSADGAVVAGVDGGAAMDDVLAFAFDHASRHSRPLHAVFCWNPILIETSPWRSAQDWSEQANRWLAEALAGWRGKYPDVAVQADAVKTRPVSGLVSASVDQELLVVGSHARPSRFGPLLGSVAQGVLHHARCPVAVIHPH
jgi:nucleotide-binding universal stress UspA family protein